MSSALSTKSPALYEAFKSKGLPAEPKSNQGSEACVIEMPQNNGELWLTREGSKDWHLGVYNFSVNPKDDGVHLMFPKTDDPEQIAEIVSGIVQRVEGTSTPLGSRR